MCHQTHQQHQRRDDRNPKYFILESHFPIYHFSTFWIRYSFRCFFAFFMPSMSFPSSAWDSSASRDSSVYFRPVSKSSSRSLSFDSLFSTVSIRDVNLPIFSSCRTSGLLSHRISFTIAPIAPDTVTTAAQIAMSALQLIVIIFFLSSL